MLAHLIRSLILVSAFAPAFVFAAVAPGDVTPEDCASQVDEIKNKSHVEDTLLSFGGLQSLIGEYKMRGLLGAIASTKVEFKVDSGLFWVSVNGDKFKQIHLCQDKESVARSAHILKLKVLQPKTPQNGMILVRPGATQEFLDVSAHRSNWKFLKFKKIKSSAARLATAE